MNDETVTNTDNQHCLAELEKMRAMMSKLVLIVKQQNEKIEAIESKLSQDTLSADTGISRRYDKGKKSNRTIKAAPNVIAYAAHLYFYKQISARKIAESGLLSQSKMQGLTTWDSQYLHDFCELKGVSDILLNGLEPKEAHKIVPMYGVIDFELCGGIDHLFKNPKNTD